MPGSGFWRITKIAARALMVASLLLSTVNASPQDARKVLFNPAPVYPEVAKSIGLKGIVKVQVVIGTDGTIKDTKIIGGHPMLVESVKDVLKKWKYAPSGSETVTILEFVFHP